MAFPRWRLFISERASRQRTAMMKGYRGDAANSKPTNTRGTSARKRWGMLCRSAQIGARARFRRLRELSRSYATIQQAMPYPGFPMNAAVHPLYLFKISALTWLFEGYSGPTGMEEKRKHPRTEIEEIAYVSSGGSVMRCVVRNISVEGAAIDVENPAFVPQRFRLVMAKDSSIVHECRVAWIQKNRIGLTFIDAADEPRANKQR